MDKYLFENLDDEYAPNITDNVDSDRESISNAIIESEGIGALLKEVARHINSTNDPEENLDDFWQDLIVDMLTAAAVTIRSRNFTRGAPAYVGTGNGGIIRRSTDKNAINIEEGIATTIKIECIEDVSTSVSEGNEIFKLFTVGDVEKDALNYPTAFIYDDETIEAKHAQSSGNIISNGDFSDYNVALTPRFSGWSSDDWTLITRETTIVYRISQGSRATGTDATEAGAGYSAKLDVAGKIYQRFEQGLGSDKTTPLCFLVFHYGSGAADGNVKCSMGSQNSSSAVSVGAWAVESLFYFPEEFDASPLDFIIERTGSSAGFVYIGNVLCIPGVKFNGEWYFMYAGGTNFILGDRWLQAVTLPVTEGKLQREIWKRTGRYLNHSTTPTIEDFTIITGTFTFNVGPSVIVNGSGSRNTLELKVGDWVWNATNDDPDSAVDIATITDDDDFTLSGVYGGTLGADKTLGIWRPDTL